MACDTMPAIFRGTTPAFKFTVPFDTAQLEEVWITLAQDREHLQTKTLADCVLDGKNIGIKLTQQETLALLGGIATRIQLRVRLKDGSALASEIFAIDTQSILKDGVI